MKVEFRRILCATDLSEFSNHAVSYAMALARQFEARLYLCHIIHLPMVTVHGAAYTYPEDYIENVKDETLLSIKSLVGQQPIDWEPIVITGPVAASISSLVDENNIDLAIAATHGRSGFKRLIIGSVTERLIRTIHCPFLIVNPPEADSNADAIRQSGFKNILVGCDFSPDSNTALEFGFSLAQEFQSVLHLVHVIEPVVYREAFLNDTLVDEMHTNLDLKLGEELEALVPEEARNWCEVRTSCVAGKPFDELTKYATIHGVDLIVLGVRGRSLMETMLLGATTARVIRRAVCPVLSVSPTGPSDTNA